jgi:riboflavin transporter FmnP
MDTPEFVISLAVPHLYATLLLAVHSATFIFLVFYVKNLFSQGMKSNPDEPVVALSAWLNFMYPRWLDRLTFQGIIKAFSLSLALAAVTWTVLAMAFLVVVAKVYGP